MPHKTIDFNKIFESDKIRLRPLCRDDKDAFTVMTRDKDLWIYFTSDLSDPEILTQWVEDAINGFRNKTRLALTIIDSVNNQIIGSTSLGNISVRDQRVEMGWTWIRKDYQGKGINRQAKYLLLQYCFEELNLERVEFKTDVLNKAARKSLLGIGAIEEGILRSHTLMTHNRRRDTIFYSILKAEWELMRSGQ
ncbi:MAG: GNAT family N-acetyltransferase [Bacteroidetes bacterium GWD2_45_23]|nr:MAG: GNAT family N-acetyltransferase [Bacteroidetes bacterium GWC2_46_850]OFX71749.1 MAG: GNAT family N-acetyltransferase [Bacteroidetes bacterium GWC1_47_7]OFX87000.1 MAG: GNAT family N-acetyltransferase [Bacteroidetes bacterium GWD2_45_23]HAR38038.1 GNAT family N-acetyltransferase [Porphyromonadaceae bacterium]HBB00515.1 GNAT family N-acetyltransferase [Porphyromonadaceae bacterium]